MSFEWLERTPPRKNGPQLRAKVAVAELGHRAGLLYRLGFTQAQATARLVARIAWEFEPVSKDDHQRRPTELSDQAIGKIVAETYARKPG
jgi:hypothetical protein